MTKKLDEISLNLDDDIGKSIIVEETLKEEKLPELTDDQKYELCLERLDKHCDKIWITYPDKTGIRFYNHELGDCPPEVFKRWLEYVHPSSKESGHKASDYKDFETRASAFLQIVKFRQLLQFPEGSYTPVTKKDKEEEEMINKLRENLAWVLYTKHCNDGGAFPIAWNRQPEKFHDLWLATADAALATIREHSSEYREGVLDAINIYRELDEQYPTKRPPPGEVMACMYELIKEKK